MIGNISRRPAIITMDKSSLENAEYPAKEHVGPTMLKPGPTLLMQAKVADKCVK